MIDCVPFEMPRPGKFINTVYARPCPQILKVIDGESVDLIVMSPPYAEKPYEGTGCSISRVHRKYLAMPRIHC